MTRLVQRLVFEDIHVRLVQKLVLESYPLQTSAEAGVRGFVIQRREELERNWTRVVNVLYR